MSHSLNRHVKSVLEKTFGVTVSRTPPVSPHQHADAALCQLRRWSGRDVVFDVGANDGRTILRLNDPLSRPRIFAFEPVSSTYRKLVERTSHLPNVRTFPVALGAKRGREDIYLSKIRAMSSFSPAWTATADGVERVDVLSVDEVMSDLQIELIHFLKIDTEGHELEVLKGAEGALQSSRVSIIQAEVGVGQIAKDFLPLEQARCYLAQRGYLLYGVYNQCRTWARPPAAWSAEEAAGYRSQVLAYCDALFIRADL